MSKHTIELRKGVSIKEGDYLRRGEEPFVILIKKITKDEDLKIRINYQAFELERMTQYLVEDRFESPFKRDFENAKVLSKSAFDSLWKEFEKPIPEKDQETLIQDFEKAIRATSNEVAAAHLKDYFQKVVIRQPEKISTYFELRKKVSARFRPCICMEHFEERVLKRFMEQLPDNFWNLIPKEVIAKRTKPKNLSDFIPREEDAKLKQLVAPFVGKDKYRMSFMGVNFDDRGIAATNAHVLLFLSKIKEGKKGVYCMTRKCFKENEGLDLLDIRYPEYERVTPNKSDKYHSYEIEVAPIIQFIKTFDSIGFSPKNVLVLNLKMDNHQVSFDAKNILLPILQTLQKLGHETIKMWFLAPNKAVVFSPRIVSMKAIREFKTNFLLGMPFYRGKTKKEIKETLIPGDIFLDIQKNTLQFHGSPNILKLGKPNDKIKILKLAKARAAAQKQRIRILELETAA